jgi:hypothetical protein
VKTARATISLPFIDPAGAGIQKLSSQMHGLAGFPLSAGMAGDS